MERDQGVERSALEDAKGHSAGFEPAMRRDAVPSTPADAAEDERHRRVMASAERVMRKHRNVFAALAK